MGRIRSSRKRDNEPDKSKEREIEKERKGRERELDMECLRHKMCYKREAEINDRKEEREFCK